MDQKKVHEANSRRVSRATGMTMFAVFIVLLLVFFVVSWLTG